MNALFLTLTLSLSLVVAEVEFSKSDCGICKLNSIRSSGDLTLSNGTEMPVAVKGDCAGGNVFESATTFCLIAQPSTVSLNEDNVPTLTLDENTALIAGPCDLSSCITSFRQATIAGDNTVDFETTTTKPEEEGKKLKRKPQKSNLNGKERSVNVSVFEQTVCSCIAKSHECS